MLNGGGRESTPGSMHLLCVIDSVIKNGAERSLAALIPHYVESGLVVDVAYFHDRPGLQNEIRDAGASLFCLDRRQGRVGWLLQTRGLIRERRPDLVHTTLFEADIAGRIAGKLNRVPVVSSFVGLNDGSYRNDPLLTSVKIRSAQLVDAATARLVTRFHALSAFVADKMSHVLHVPRARIDVIPRGRDPQSLGTRSAERVAQVRTTLGLDPSQPIVLAVARHDHRKGLDVLLEALPPVLAQVPGVRLLVAGAESSQTERLRAAASDLRLVEAVRFLGPRDDVPDLLCLADVFVMPSRSEGLNGSLLEAMALEAPIVATNIPPVREVMGGEDGALLVRPADAASLAGGILRALADPKGARSRAVVARRRFLSNYTIDRVARRMLEFFERALADSGREQKGNGDLHRPAHKRGLA